MYNYTNTALAILTRAGILSEEIGEKLSKEMASLIHPATYSEALKMIDKLEVEWETAEKKTTAKVK